MAFSGEEGSVQRNIRRNNATLLMVEEFNYTAAIIGEREGKNKGKDYTKKIEKILKKKLRKGNDSFAAHT